MSGRGHAGTFGTAGRSDDLVTNRIDRADVIDEAAVEIDAFGQWFVFGVKLLNALMGGIAAGENPAADQQGFTGLPFGDIGFGQAFEPNPADVGTPFEGDLRPGLDVGRGEDRRSLAVEVKMDMPGGGAIGDHGHRQ